MGKTTIAIFCFAALMLNGSAWAKEEALVEVIVTDGGAKILSEGKVPIVEIPREIVLIIDKRYPQLRIPSDRDYKLAWREYYFDQKTPFVALGDANFDGMTDVAMLLIGKEKDEKWAFVVFQRTESNGYNSVALVTSPDRKTKRSYGAVQKHSIMFQGQCTSGKPCFALYADEAAGFEYVWRQGKYEEITIGD